MKMMSRVVIQEDIEGTKAWLVKEGAILFKVVEDDYETFPYVQYYRIIFCVNEETATMFKLKYAKGYFQEHK